MTALRETENREEQDEIDKPCKEPRGVPSAETPATKGDDHREHGGPHVGRIERRGMRVLFIEWDQSDGKEGRPQIEDNAVERLSDSQVQRVVGHGAERTRLQLSPKCQTGDDSRRHQEV